MTEGGTRRRGRGSRAVVLVVEDEVLVRLAVAMDLSEAGYDVIEAADAGEALAVLEDGHAVDLVFSDIHMPGPMNGLALCRRVRERYPHIAVILTSAQGAPAGEALATATCGAGLVFIPKPYLSTTVLAAVRRRIGEMAGRQGAEAG